MLKAKEPQNPLRFIQQCVKMRRIYWTYHVNMRLRTRSIPRAWVLDSVNLYEVIESYPDDKYLPSYLVWTQAEGVMFHVLFATDVDAENVRIVTAYRPGPAEWAEGRRRRRTV
ncbi:MAG: DUF4258 domain-containing protein [Nitrococcus mobilis]|nr:DUF4258 domain-containing protein [Nitrococcus mobilis]